MVLSVGAVLLACSGSSTTSGGGTISPGSDASQNGTDGSTAGDLDSGSGGNPGTTDGSVPSGTDAGSTDSGSGADASTPLVLTSSLLKSGGTWPTAYTCGGANASTSPPFAWSGGPAAKSYALVMVDAFFAPPKVHWLIYDMPPATAALGAGIPSGYTVATPSAHQSLGDFTGAQYLAPCPPMGGGAHTYEVTIHALDVATLPGLTMNSTATQSHDAVKAHSLASAKMSLTFSR
jgi:hypothetical protein